MSQTGDNSEQTPWGGHPPQVTPGVERAVAGARGWADRLGSESVRLAHLVLALLDEDEGHPAVLLERIGLTVPVVRRQLAELHSPAAPPLSALSSAARAWSIAHRHDPEFLTDALLIAVLTSDSGFRAHCAAIGIPVELLEQTLTIPAASSESETEFGVFELPNTPEVIQGKDERELGGVWRTAATGNAGENSPCAIRPISPNSTPHFTYAEMDTARILDANFNRAREAARVLEDYCRFALDDRLLTEQVKELRHGLVDAARKLPQSALLAARETLRDVGTTTTARGEYDRASPANVATVNVKRLQESLRSLEEFGKVVGPELGRDLEALRYQAYTLERAMTRGATSRERLAAARLYVLVTRGQCTAPLDWTIRAAARGGADVFQLREKAVPDRELLECARNVRQWTREVGVLFIVNDRPDIARLCEADGVHLGQDDLSVKDARRIAGPEVLVGVSTHTVEQLRGAVLDGADYVGIGPTFPSTTKGFNHFPGLEFVRTASAETTLPAFALGGIGPGNVAHVVAAGARRVAVSAAVCAADDPEQAARLLKASLPL